ncbi:CoA-dependent acyltransferase, partial [Periconia macrospinosa]
LGHDLDTLQLEKSCVLTTKKFPVLRACFPEISGRFWQVILHQLEKPFSVVEVDDLTQSFHNFCLRDASDFSPTQPPLAFVLLRHKSQGNRLVLRISHAQYDGFSLPIIVGTLLAYYHDKAPLNAPDFSLFLSYAAQHRSASIAYWKKLLQGSSPVTIQDISKKLLLQGCVQDSPPEGFLAEAETTMPRLSGNITSATLVSTAWAVLLARLIGRDDITYGHLIAGRNSALRGIEHIVGPCINIVPVRVKIPAVVKPTDLLRSVQEQFLAVGEADSLGFADIIKHCTDWRTTSRFDINIQHQNIDEHPEFTFQGTKNRLQFFQYPNILPMSQIHLMCYPEHGRLRINLTTDTSIMCKETANSLLASLMKIIRQL